MLKKVGLVIGVIVGIFLVRTALQPAEYVISRDILINAPVAKVFPFLNNSKLAESWGPWREEDPDAKMSYSGPDEGVGSRADWTGGKKLGIGSATIVESIPNEKVGIKLEYLEPMNMNQHSDYIVKSEGNQTHVTWRVEGKNNFIGRLMCSIFNMDKTVGGFFEKGLKNLKTLAEK